MVHTCKGPIPIQELLEVQIERTSMTLADDTSVRSKLTVVHIADACASGFVHTHTSIESKCKILKELNFCVSGSVNGITLTVVCIEGNSLKRIGISGNRTRETCIATISKVISFVSVLVILDALVCIPEVYRVDRCYHSRETEDISY